MKPIVMSIVLLLAGCTPDPPSDQCQYAWRMRGLLKDLVPTTITDTEKKSGWLYQAAECDRYPTMIWF